MRIALLTLLASCLALIVSCREQEPQPVVEKIVEYRDRPSASVSGEIGVPGGFESVGVMVFAEGTSHMAITDQQGRFLLSGLPEGEFTVRALRNDLEPLSLGTITVSAADFKKAQPFQSLARVLMDAKPDDSPGVTGQGRIMAANRYGVLRGTVTTEIPGEEGGVLVRLEGTPARTATLPDGSFELYRVEPGSYSLSFSKAGYQDATRGVTVQADQVSQVPPIDLRSTGGGPRPARTVYGTVDLLTADGTPVEDLSVVRVVLEGTQYIATPSSTGTFEIRGVPPGAYVVSATAPGYLLERKARIDLTNVSAAEANLTLLEDTTDQMTRGIVMGRVLLTPPPDTGSGGVAVSLVGTSMVAFTDPNGRYRIDNVDAGTYDVMATLSGYESGLVQGLVVKPLEPTVVEDMTLTKEQEAPRIVLVRPADGARDVTIAQPTIAMIQFSERMDPESVFNAIRISPEAGWRFSPERTLGRGQDAFYIEMNAVPGDGAAALNYGTRYTIAVAKTAQSIAGVPMKEDESFSFTTGYPEIIATEPADGSQRGMFLYSEPIWVYFNAPIDPESMDVDDIDFEPDLPGSPILFWKTDTETGWTNLQIQGRGEYGTSYRVTIRGGVRTITGQRVRNTPYRWTFKTRELKSFEDEYNTTIDEDAAERERERQ
jgi:hypothetical protein